MNLRSILENILLLIALAGAGLSVTLWIQVERHKVNIGLLETQVETQKRSISRLDRLRSADSESINTLNGRVESLTRKDSDARRGLHELEVRDEEASEYLSSDVHPGVGCLFDDSCSGDSSAFPARGTFKALLLAPEHEPPVQPGTSPAGP